MPREREKLCVIGCGLMGGSLLMGLEGKGYEIWAVDTDEQVVREVLGQGLAERASVQSAEAIAWADITVLCVMPQTAMEIISRHADAFAPGSILTDFCGVKSAMLATAQECLPQGVSYVGAHPMAGLERGKFISATAILYQRSNALLTFASGTNPEAIEAVSCLLKRAGCARVLQCSAEKHDEMIGFTSQLMHLLAASIANHPLYPLSRGYEGGSLRDFTRIATLDAEMWSALCMLNREYLTPVLKDYISQLTLILETLERDDVGRLKEVLSSSNTVKEQWIHAPAKRAH